MGRKPVSEPVRIRIKELMLEYGKSYSSAMARRTFKTANDTAIRDNLNPPWHLYSEKSYQRVMTEYRKDGIFTKGSTYDFHAPFKYSESIGTGPLQILPEDSHYALEVVRFYLENFRHTCSIGFVQEYVKISRYDPEWDDVQQKSLNAEIFWVHRIKKVIEGRDPGSVEYEELKINMRMRKESAGRQIQDLGVVDEHGNLSEGEWENTPNEKYELFQSIVAEKGLKPWSQTVRDSRDYLPYMPQANHVRETGHAINADLTFKPYYPKPKLFVPVDEDDNIGDPIIIDDFEPPLPEKYEDQ